MNFLPYANLTYKTHLSKDEIVKKLSKKIEPKQWIRMSGVFADNSYQPYEGSISENTFKINRIIGYRNSFLPHIKGEIEETKDSTLIHIKMRLHIFVLVFMSIWLSVVGIVSIGVLSSLFFIDGNQEFNIGFFIPFFMLLFGLLMPTLAFRYEANKSKKFFEKLFEVEKQGFYKKGGKTKI